MAARILLGARRFFYGRYRINEGRSEMEISKKKPRFAAIPKCASRSLAALGLCGELHNKRHSKITEYPYYQEYEWFYIDRNPEDWYRSWWLECQASENGLARALGMKFDDFAEDMACFGDVSGMQKYDRETGHNAWVPANRDAFVYQLSKFQALGLGFKEYCFSSIMDGVPCKQVHLSRLDPWLAARGLRPVHENAKQIYRGLSREEFFSPHPDLMALARQLKATNQLGEFVKLLGNLIQEAPISGEL